MHVVYIRICDQLAYENGYNIYKYVYSICMYVYSHTNIIKDAKPIATVTTIIVHAKLL